jgi:hypothetical protein
MKNQGMFTTTICSPSTVRHILFHRMVKLKFDKTLFPFLIME